MSMLRNRTVWLFCLAGLVVGSSACVSGDGDRAFTVGWSLVYVGGNNRVSCEAAGTPTVRLTMNNITTNETFVSNFPCNVGGGTSNDLPGGRYTVRIALLGAGEKEMSVQEGDFALNRHGLTDLGDIGFEVQSFHLAWTLARGGRSLACQDVDGKTVNLRTRLASEPEVVHSFPCIAGAGSTPAIQVGTYAVGVALLNSANAVLWETNQPMTVAVDDERRAVLEPIRFDLP